jgi:3-hydroxyacyl-CoA dehydrogenase
MRRCGVQVKRKRMSSFDADRTLSRLIGVHDGMESWQKHMGNCDLVIEAGARVRRVGAGAGGA